MRSDYTLYVVAIICFILAAVVFAGSADYAGYLHMETQITMITTAVLAIVGIISAGAGYLVRPQEIMPAPPPRPPAPKPSAYPPTPPPKITTTPPIEITEVKGIGPKRAEQLRALGINTAQDLAKTTATTLAAKTELSPTITRKWVRAAKRLIKEAS
jgi:predicted flap endonuclease-1-like 5' DNA nuclease